MPQLQLPAIADTFVAKDDPAQEHANDNPISVGYFEQVQGLVKFSLNTILQALPAATEITSATLVLHVDSVNQDPEISCQRTRVPFFEDYDWIAWSNGSLQNCTGHVARKVITSTGTFALDVKHHCQNIVMFRGPTADFCLYQSDLANSHDLWINSRESTTPTERPLLIMDYQPL